MLRISDLAAATKQTPAQVKKALKKASNFAGASAFDEGAKPADGDWDREGIPAILAKQYFLERGTKFPHRVVSVQMLKGGVAKTTTVLNLGLRAAMYGARVLFIDLDQQANLTFALGVESETLPVWVDIADKKVTPFQTLQKIDAGTDLIPSNLNNSVLDRVLMNSNRNWAHAVSGPLLQIRENYDLILIDTAPALSTINTAATIASDVVLLPTNPDRFSWLGLKKHRLELEDIKKDFSLHFRTKILFTRFDGREKSSHEILQNCIQDYADEMMQGYIRTSSEVKNAIDSGRNIFQSRNPVREDYDLVTREILEFF